MTYKEFQNQINRLNVIYGAELEVRNDGHSTFVEMHEITFARVSNSVPYCVDMCYFGSLALDDNLRHDLLKIVYEFAQTPVDSRNLYPKFYISSTLTSDYDMRFLVKFNGDIDSLAWGYQNGGNTEFTQKEIDYICDKFHTNLRDFKIEEVEE